MGISNKARSMAVKAMAGFREPATAANIENAGVAIDGIYNDAQEQVIVDAASGVTEIVQSDPTFTYTGYEDVAIVKTNQLTHNGVNYYVKSVSLDRVTGITTLRLTRK